MFEIKAPIIRAKSQGGGSVYGLRFEAFYKLSNIIQSVSRLAAPLLNNKNNSNRVIDLSVKTRVACALCNVILIIPTFFVLIILLYSTN